MDKYDKATLILESGQVQVETVSATNSFYHVKDYSVRWNKIVNRWSCTCPNYPLRPDVECSHILACKLYLWAY